MIIFDLDGTLINSEKFLKEVEAELKCELGFPITVAEQIKKYGGIGPHQQLDMDRSLPKEFAEIAEKRFKEQAKDKLMPCPGVVEFLENCEHDRVIASNGPLDWIVTALEVTSLKKYFENEKLFHVGLVENKKPAPDLFLLASINNDPKNVIVIEDSITGVRAGLAAELKTLGYIGSSTEPDDLKQKMKNLGVSTTFEHFSELRKLLDNTQKF